jgi:hypothetical protein
VPTDSAMRRGSRRKPTTYKQAWLNAVGWGLFYASVSYLTWCFLIGRPSAWGFALAFGASWTVCLGLDGSYGVRVRMRASRMPGGGGSHSEL